jgi:hypothetical protein
MRASAIRCMAASNRSSRVAAAYFERRLQIWDAEKAKCLNEFATFFSFGGFRLTLDPLCERCIAAAWQAGTRGGVARYETNTGKRIWYRQDLRQTQRVRFSPGGETVWCVPDSGPTKLLDASSGKTLDALTGLTGIFDSEYSADLPLEKRKRDYILRKQKALQISTPDICNLGCRIWSSVTSNERSWWSYSLRRLSTGIELWRHSSGSIFISSNCGIAKRIGTFTACSGSSRRVVSGLLLRLDANSGEPHVICQLEPFYLTIVKHHDHRLPLSGTFVVKCLGRNSRSKFPPTRPARPTAALLKTRLAPRFACG